MERHNSTQLSPKGRTTNKQNSASSNFPVLKYRIILRDTSGKVVKTRNTKNPRKVHTVLRSLSWYSADLTVYYGDGGLNNQGTYYSLEEFAIAFAAFTDPNLLGFLSEAH